MIDTMGHTGGGNNMSTFITDILGDTIKRNPSTNKPSEKMDKLYEAMNVVAALIDKNARSELEQAKQHVENVIKVYRSINGVRKSNSGILRESKKQTAQITSVASNIKKIYQEAKRPNTLWFGVSKFGPKAYSQLVRAIQTALGGSSRSYSGGSPSSRSRRGGMPPLPSSRSRRGGMPPIPPTPPGSGTPPGGSPGGAALGVGGNLVLSALGVIAIKLGEIGDAFMKSLDLDLNQVFEGIVSDENRFKENIRATIFQTQGLVGANRELEKELMNVDNAVNRTGLKRSAFQKIWMENMQRGFLLQNRQEAQEFKTAKGREQLTKRHVVQMKSITMSAANTAQMLDISAEQMNEMFMNMRFNMNMSAGDVLVMSRNMKQIARDTGLTGDRLGKALANAERLMQMMADSGALTADAAENLNRMMASAEKYNIGEQMSQFATATSGMTGWVDSSDSMKRLLTLAAERSGIHINTVRSGAAMSNAATAKQFTAAFSDVLQGTFMQMAGGSGNLRGFGVSDEAIKSGNMTEIIKQLNEAGVEGQTLALRLQYQFKQFAGMNIGEAQRQITAFEESQMTFYERTLKIRKEINEAQNKGDKNALKEAQARLHEQENTQFLNTAQRLAELRKELGGKGLSEAQIRDTLAQRMTGQFMDKGMSQADALKRSQGYVSGLDSQSNQWVQGMNARIKQLQDQGSYTTMEGVFKKYGPEMGYSSMDDLRKGLVKGEESALLASQAIDEELNTLERTMSDPMTAMRHHLRDINEQIREISQSYLLKISNSLLYIIAIGSKILTSLGVISATFSLIRMAFNLFSGRGIPIANIGAMTSGIATSIVSVFNRFTGFLSTLFGRLPRLISGPLSVITTPISGLLTKIAGSSGLLARGATGALRFAGVGGAKAALAGSTGGVALAVFAAIDGAMGAWKGYKKTADVFSESLKNADGSMREATWGMKAASTQAGAVTGILDGLTLGLLGLVGLKEPLHKFLSWIYYSLFLPFEKLFEGIIEGAKQAWETLAPQLKQIWDSVKEIGEIFNDLFKEIGEMFGMPVQDSMDFMKKSWEIIGPIFKGIGWLIGTVLVNLIKMFIPYIKLVIELIKDLVNIFVGLIKVIVGVIKFVYNLGKFFAGLLTFNTDMMKDALKGMWDSIKLIFKGLGQAIWGLIKGIFDATIGSIIATISSYLAPVVDIFTPIYNFINSIPGYISSGLSAIPILIKSAMPMIANLVINVCKKIGDWIYENTIGRFAAKTPATPQEKARQQANTLVATAGFGPIGYIGSKTKWGQAVMDKINPLNYFDEGTRQILKPGVAVLHEGEMVVPKNVWQNIKAVGDGSFNSGGLKNWFTRENIDNISNKMSQTVDPFRIVSDAMGGDDTNPWISMAKSLWYGDEFTPTNAEGASISPSDSLNYSDAIKGEVTTLMRNDKELENTVASRLMTNKLTKEKVAEKVSDTEKEIELMKLMVQYLNIIAENTSPEQFNQIVGSSKLSVPPSRPSSIKKAATDLLSGYWGLQGSQSSPTTVNTDGHGMK